ncbi:MAG: FG-GAP repeat protein [Planctomycetota bacterium]
MRTPSSAHRLAGRVDVNLHGSPDIVIGALDFASGATTEGYVYVFAGETSNLVYFFRGVADGDHFGESVSAGDIDHDGFPDVIVGAPDEIEFPYAHGRVRVYGAYGNLIRTYSGGYFSNDHFGASVACLGDINKDHFEDLVIADDYYDGAAGSGTGAAYVYSGEPYAASWENYGTGWPGTNGVPSLTLSDDPVLCSTIKLEIGNSRGYQTLGALLIGMDDAQIDSHMGGTVLVAPPWFIVTLSIPPAGLKLPVQVICDSAFAGVSVFMQMLEVDSGASWDTSFSRGLKMVHGI